MEKRSMKRIKFFLVNQKHARLILFGLLLLLSITHSFAQNVVSIELTQRSQKPISEFEHTHRFEVSNKNNQTVIFDLNASIEDCGNNLAQSNLEYQLLDSNKNPLSPSVTIPARKSVTILLRTKRNTQSKLQTWNCIELKAIDSDNQMLGSTRIKSFIPDPKNNG